MALYLIGLGLSDEKDLSVKALEAIKGCDIVYLENYTSRLNVPIERLEKLYGKKLILADREMVESQAEKTILKEAKTKDVAFLVVGDIFSATTHTDLWLRAGELGIATRLIHGAGIFSGISETGLQLYKFGRTTSIPFPAENWKPETPYDILTQNKAAGSHTLILLDLSPKDDRFMTVADAIQYLLDTEAKRRQNIFTDATFCIGCARLGSGRPTIISGAAKKLLKAEFGAPLHCLIVPGRLHFAEEKALSCWEKA
jgi:diphthine synthase